MNRNALCRALALLLILNIAFSFSVCAAAHDDWAVVSTSGDGSVVITFTPKGGDGYFNIRSSDGKLLNSRSWDHVLFAENEAVIAGIAGQDGKYTYFRVGGDGSETLLGIADYITMTDRYGYFYCTAPAGTAPGIDVSYSPDPHPVAVQRYGVLSADFELLIPTEWDWLTPCNEGYFIGTRGSDLFTYERGLGWIGNGLSYCLDSNGEILFGGYDSITYKGGKVFTAEKDGAETEINLITRVTTDRSYDDWAKNDVESAKALRIVPVGLQSEYTRPITRGEYCRLAVELLCEAYDTTADALAESAGASSVSFSDTNDRYILTAAALGIVQGVGGGLYEPERTITRQEAAVLLGRMAARLGVAENSQRPAYADAGEIADWALESVLAVGAMVNPHSGAALMQGVGSGSFAPEDSYSRQQSIVTMLRLYNLK